MWSNNLSQLIGGSNVGENLNGWSEIRVVVVVVVGRLGLLGLHHHREHC